MRKSDVVNGLALPPEDLGIFMKQVIPTLQGLSGFNRDGEEAARRERHQIAFSIRRL